MWSTLQMGHQNLHQTSATLLPVYFSNEIQKLWRNKLKIQWPIYYLIKFNTRHNNLIVNSYKNHKSQFLGINSQQELGKDRSENNEGEFSSFHQIYEHIEVTKFTQHFMILAIN
jgi:hypothetical protein